MDKHWQHYSKQKKPAIEDQFHLYERSILVNPQRQVVDEQFVRLKGEGNSWLLLGRGIPSWDDEDVLKLTVVMDTQQQCEYNKNHLF